MNNEQPVAWMDSPKKIYLIVSEDDFFYCKNYRELEDLASKGEDILWCEDSQNDTDIEYVRADLTHPARTLTEQDLDKLIKDAEKGGYMDLYIIGLIDGFNHARTLLKKASEK